MLQEEHRPAAAVAARLPRANLLALALALASCGTPLPPAPAATPPAAPAEVPPSRPATAGAASAAPACGPLDIPELAPTGPAVCELAPGPGTFALSSPGGVVFARGAATARVRLAAEGAFAWTTPQPGLALAGFDRDLRLHLTRPMVVGGYLVPAPAARHRWTAEGGKIRIESDPRALAARLPPTALVDCHDLSLQVTEFDAAAALPREEALRRVVLERPARLSTAPGAPGVATVPPGKHLIEVLATRGASSLVRGREADFTFFGWVSSGAVPAPRRDAGARGNMYGAETCCSAGQKMDIALGPEPSAPRPAPREIQCSGPVRLVIEVRGERFVAGSLSAPARIRAWTTGEALTELDPQSFWPRDLALVEGRLLAPTCDLALCR